jgi:hypothetical protein
MAKFTYRLEYSNDDSGDRGYEVLRRHVYIGYVDKDWAPNPTTPGGTPVRCWMFRGADGRYGEGPTRDAAVEAALALPVPERATPS